MWPVGQTLSKVLYNSFFDKLENYGALEEEEWFMA
jgi:hypothetical protein